MYLYKYFTFYIKLLKKKNNLKNNNLKFLKKNFLNYSKIHYFINIK